MRSYTNPKYNPKNLLRVGINPQDLNKVLNLVFVKKKKDTKR